MSITKTYFLNEFDKAKAAGDSTSMARAFHDLSERKLLSKEELNKFVEEGYYLHNEVYLESLLKKFFETLNPNEIIDAITIYVTNLVYLYEMESFDNSNKIYDLIDNLERITSDLDFKLHIKELKETAKLKEKLERQVTKLLDGEVCEEREIKKWDLIKCNTYTDFENLREVENFIDKVWQNPLVEKFLSLIAVFMAEGKDFKFIFTTTHEPLAYGKGLISNLDPEIFEHELYHVMQTILFKRSDHYIGGRTKENFEIALKKTYLNILHFIGEREYIADTSYSLISLGKAIKEKIPEMKWFDYCDPKMQKIWVEDFYQKNKSVLEIERDSGYVLPFKIDENYRNIEAVVEETNQHCESVKAKYNFRSEEIKFMGRVNYFLTCKDETADFSIVEDEKCTDFSHRTETIPSLFQIHEQGFSSDLLDLMQPMTNYVIETVLPIIENYENLHVEHHCNQNIIGEAVEFSGQCIIDLKTN